jgi:hypothetical protein
LTNEQAEPLAVRAAGGAGHAGGMSQPDPDAELRAADRTIALIGAMGYMRGEFAAARMEWGSQGAPPVPDDIDEIWLEPAGHAGNRDRWFAVTAVSGSYEQAERSYSWGQRVLAGTREYPRFAVERLREHCQDRQAGALETEMLAGRPVYLELTTEGDSMETIQVRARQHDITDETVVAGILGAVRDRDWKQDEDAQAAGIARHRAPGR